MAASGLTDMSILSSGWRDGLSILSLGWRDETLPESLEVGWCLLLYVVIRSIAIVPQQMVLPLWAAVRSQ